MENQMEHCQSTTLQFSGASPSMDNSNKYQDVELHNSHRNGNEENSKKRSRGGNDPADNQERKQQKQIQSKKGQQGDDAYKRAYEEFRYEKITTAVVKTDTGNVGKERRYQNDVNDMLSRYFESSYRVFRMKTKDNEKSTTPVDTTDCCHQIVHKHVNGLVIVTAGKMFAGTDSTTIESLHFPPSVLQANIDAVINAHRSTDDSPITLSAGEKRKLISKLLKTKTTSTRQVPYAIRPGDTLATVKTKSVETARVEVTDLCSSVFGLVMELNHGYIGEMANEDNCNEKLTKASLSLLQSDPLLDGYLAIILPAGPFPPPDNVINT